MNQTAATTIEDGGARAADSDAPAPGGLPPRPSPGPAWQVRWSGYLLPPLMAGLLATLSLLRHARHDTYAHDLGLLAQVVFNNLHGRWYETTLVGGNYLGEHFSPALLLLSPLYLLWPDAGVLLVAQAIALALGGWFVWLAARDRFGDTRGGWAAALLVQAAYFLAPGLAWVARAEFHQIALAVPFLAAGGRDYLRGRYGRAALLAGLALLANEDAALAVGGFALSLLAVRKWRAGGLLLGVAAAWLGAYLFVIAPAVRARSLLGAVPPTVFGAFADLGTTREAVVTAILRDPLGFLARAVGPGRPPAWLAIVGPSAGLAFFSPLVLSWLPTFALLVLGAAPERYRMHYVAPLLPLIALAAIDGIDRLRRRFGWSPVLPAGAVGLTALVVALWGSPLPGGGAYQPSWYALRPHDAVLDRALAVIPRDPGVAVSASTELVSHLALRRDIWLFPGMPEQIEYVIADTKGSAYPTPSADEFARQFAIVRSDPSFETVFEEAGVSVLRRVAQPPEPSLDVDFGGQIKLARAEVSTPDPGIVRLDLTWAATRPPERDYTRFVHVFAPKGERVAQWDSQPLENRFPTTEWPAGRLVREIVDLPVPAEARDQPLRVIVGWYDLATGERLSRPDGSSEYTVTDAARVL